MSTKETSMPKTEYVIEPGKQEIITTTVLDAPRELVFRAYTEPELFEQWWGPRRYKTEIEKFQGVELTSIINMIDMEVTAEEALIASGMAAGVAEHHVARVGPARREEAEVVAGDAHEELGAVGRKPRRGVEPAVDGAGGAHGRPSRRPICRF